MTLKNMDDKINRALKEDVSYTIYVYDEETKELNDTIKPDSMKSLKTVLYNLSDKDNGYIVSLKPITVFDDRTKKKSDEFKLKCSHIYDNNGNFLSQYKNLKEDLNLTEEQQKAFYRLAQCVFIPKAQKKMLSRMFAREEIDAIVELVNNIYNAVENAPGLYATEGQKEKKPILHYFYGSYDSYAYELDKKTGEMFGHVNLGYGYELGYFSMEEINSVPQIELDLHYEGTLPNLDEAVEEESKLSEIVNYIYNKLPNPQHPLLNIEVVSYGMGIGEDWIIADYDIDNDLENTYSHEDLIDELYELNDNIRIFDEITDLGSGILELNLSIGEDTPYEDIDNIIKGMEQIPAIIKKYYDSSMNESKDEDARIENGKVICTAYGKDKEFDTIKDAQDYFTSAYLGCDPNSSEADRYLDVLGHLFKLEGKSITESFEDLNEEGFTDRVDINFEISLSEYGVVRNPENNMTLLGTKPTDKGVYSDYEVTYISLEDVKEALDEMEEGFFDYIDQSKEDILKEIDPNNLAYLIMSMNAYNGKFSSLV